MEEYTNCKSQLASFAFALEQILEKKDCYDFTTIIWFCCAFNSELNKCNSLCKSLGIEDDEFQFLSEMEDLGSRFSEFVKGSTVHLEKFWHIGTEIGRSVLSLIKISDHVCNDVVNKYDGNVVLSDATIRCDKKDIMYIVDFLSKFSENFDCYKADITKCAEKAQEVDAMLDKYAKDREIWR